MPIGLIKFGMEDRLLIEISFRKKLGSLQLFSKYQKLEEKITSLGKEKGMKIDRCPYPRNKMISGRVNFFLYMIQNYHQEG